MALAVAPIAAATLRIPSVPIQPNGHLPMLLLGVSRATALPPAAAVRGTASECCNCAAQDGLSWNRPSNYTLWYELAGKNAGIDSAWDYRTCDRTFQHCNHTQQYILPAVERAGAQRGDVFVVSKIPCGGYDGGEEPMTTALAESYVAQVLAELGTDYVDLLLLHHVCTTRQETLLAWRVLEAALGRGQARAIGVSNFDTPDLRWLLGVAKEPVAANECHFAAGMMDDEMIRFAAAANISLMAYGVLHGTIDPSDPAVAAKHNVSAVGVLLRFVGQHNIALVTASDKRSYDVEDAALFDLTLDAEDLAALRALQPGPRSCSDCYAKPCRTCMAAVQAAGCQPGTAAKCISCVANLSAPAVRDACDGGDAVLVAKACEMGFPQ